MSGGALLAYYASRPELARYTVETELARMAYSLVGGARGAGAVLAMGSMQPRLRGTHQLLELRGCLILM